MPDRLFAGTISLLGAVLAILGSVLLWNESMIFLKGGTSKAEQLTPLVTGSYAIGLSVFSNRLLMQDCYQALNAAHALRQTSEIRRAYAQNCITAADDILRKRPTDGLAYLVKARAHGFLGYRAAMEDALLRSQALSPQEGWIANARLSFALPLYQKLPEALKTAVASDVAVLASSRRSAAWLAQLYLRKDKNPDVLLQILDTLPDASKGNVLAEIRTATSLR